PTQYTSCELLLGVYAYAIQIYCDFSAYSDIAIGSSLLLGLELPPNFNAPYRARDLRDFWRRWHISLSAWLRDYLYISLGGSKGSAFSTYRNLMLTMVLGGLWHGAGWTFVAWGFLHGIGLSITRAWQRWRTPKQYRWPVKALALVATFHFVCLGWIFFRAPKFEQAWEILRGLCELSFGTANITPLLWCLLGVGFVTHLVPDSIVEVVRRQFVHFPAFVQAVLLLGVILGVKYATTTDVAPFIYFQF
ncbi:MAG: MBOAT family O-acyltransferase, partial [Pseudomonadota bacterium]